MRKNPGLTVPGEGVLPAELRQALDRVELPEWAAWLAQDQDGAWWVYEAEPNQHASGWYENEVGRSEFLCRTVPPECWQQKLLPLDREIPGETKVP